MSSTVPDERWVNLPGGNYAVLISGGGDLTDDKAQALVAYFEHHGIRKAHVVPEPPDSLPPGAIADAKSREGKPT